jgi:succinate dehydrogenase/fumarate reductase flavoprotein subunit
MQTQGLFDITPEMVDLSIAQETQQRAATALPGNDLAGIVYAGRLAGNRAGNILGEALGQVDPRKQQAMKVQDALKEVQESGINMNEDPASFYTKMSEAFAKRGMMNQATQASMKGTGD